MLIKQEIFQGFFKLYHSFNIVFIIIILIINFSIFREFLESIYTEISNLPLRTEKNDVSATLTPEMWLDLQLQAQMNPEQGFLITTICPPDILYVSFIN